MQTATFIFSGVGMVFAAGAFAVSLKTALELKKAKTHGENEIKKVKTKVAHNAKVVKTALSQLDVDMT
jgi:hypothetical protein